MKLIVIFLLALVSFSFAQTTEKTAYELTQQDIQERAWSINPAYERDERDSVLQGLFGTKAIVTSGAMTIGGNMTMENGEQLSNTTDGDVRFIFDDDATTLGQIFFTSWIDTPYIADNDKFELIIQANDDSSGMTNWSTIETTITDASDESEDSKVVIKTLEAGSEVSPLTLEGDNATFADDVLISGDLIVLGAITLHGDMYFNTNTNAQAPDDNDTVGVINFTVNDVTGFTFDAGSDEPFTEAVTYGGGDTTGIYDAGTAIEVGDRIYIHGSSVGAYDGGHVIVLVDSDTLFFAETFSATATGRYSQASSLTLAQSGIVAQTFEVSMNFSVQAAGSPAGDVIDWGIAINGVAQVPLVVRRTLTVDAKWGNASADGLVTLTTGDEITMFLVSDDNNALTHRYGNVVVHQD